MLVKLTPEGIYYNDKEHVLWEQTNFPNPSTFGIKEQLEIYWQLRQLTFDKGKGKLVVTPINYSPSTAQISKLKTQSPKYAIQVLEFKNIQWTELERLLFHYSPKAFDPIVVRKEEPTTTITENQGSLDFDTELSQAEIKALPKMEMEFKVKVKDLAFKAGYIELQRKTRYRSSPVLIKLYNDSILPQFEYIKFYFPKVFKKKAIQVKGWIKMWAGEIVEKSFQSSEVQLIDEETITVVKHLMIKDAIKKPSVITVDKSLFTNEDFFEGLHGEELGNTIKADEKELFEELKKLEGVRNKKQLAYLSGKIQAEDEKIRFTLHPHFGFLFCHKGVRMLHFIWELVDSHATYIWSCEYDESIPTKIGKVEEIISFIKTNGRQIYLESDKKEQFIFSRIIHEQAGLVKGFPKWKVRLNEKMI